MKFHLRSLLVALLMGVGIPYRSLEPAAADQAPAHPIHHYVFFNRDRERISETNFLQTKAFEGAQLKYSWRQLERGEDGYDFSDIQHDLDFLKSKGKKLFIQIQDASFDPAIIPIPQYLLKNPRYHGGADKQYAITNDDEAHAQPAGWVARRWDPAVRERFGKLLLALGKEFDGKIEGVNLPETAVDFGETGLLYPASFTPQNYRDAIISNMAALSQAFPRSITIQYANFMPEEKGDTEPRHLQAIYLKAKEVGVGLGGPDLLPYKPYQMSHSYPLLKDFARHVPTAIAVQDGNYQHINPKTGRRVTIAELNSFAADYLGVQYIFWCTQEPYYTQQLLPFLKSLP
jgi:hypothetical protein